MLPGKYTLPIAAQILGVSLVTYKKMVEGGLASRDEGSMTFRSALEAALRPYLPPREYIDPAIF